MIYYTNRWGAVHYPLVGPNIKAFLSLVKKFPKTHFYALENDLNCLHALQSESQNETSCSAGLGIKVLVAENHVITEHWTVDARR